LGSWIAHALPFWSMVRRLPISDWCVWGCLDAFGTEQESGCAWARMGSMQLYSPAWGRLACVCMRERRYSCEKV
jgi:hypothetical protein